MPDAVSGDTHSRVPAVACGLLGEDLMSYETQLTLPSKKTVLNGSFASLFALGYDHLPVSTYILSGLKLSEAMWMSKSSIIYSFLSDPSGQALGSLSMVQLPQL